MKSYSSTDLSSLSLYRQFIDHLESRSIIDQQLPPHLTLLDFIDTTAIPIITHTLLDFIAMVDPSISRIPSSYTDTCCFIDNLFRAYHTILWSMPMTVIISAVSSSRSIHQSLWGSCSIQRSELDIYTIDTTDELTNWSVNKAAQLDIYLVEWRRQSRSGSD